MALQVVSYEQVRKQMRCGDVIAFGGKTGFSNLIKEFTRSAVSHVGVVLQTKATYEAQDSGRYFTEVVESTKFKKFMGVGRIRLSDRLMDYEGEAWWLPLRRDLYDSKFNVAAFFDFLFAQIGKPYSLLEAVKSACDKMEKIFGTYSPTYNEEDFSAFFCSELVAAALEKAGFVGQINASEVTPIDLCCWNIFEPDYYQIYWVEPPQPGQPPQPVEVPEKVAIKGFNTLDPTTWNV